MAASQIFIIRHAEKPDKGTDGVLPTGEKDPDSLIVQGWQRAGALGRLFVPAPGQPIRSGLAVPSCLFASAIAKHSESKRPQQTISVVATLLGTQATANYTFAKDDDAKMAKAAAATSGVVLICWEHQDIPAIANAILGNDTTVPQKWPGDRFDMIWSLAPSGSGGWQFTQIPQLLLPGDQSTPIG